VNSGILKQKFSDKKIRQLQI